MNRPYREQDPNAACAVNNPNILDELLTIMMDFNTSPHEKVVQLWMKIHNLPISAMAFNAEVKIKDGIIRVTDKIPMTEYTTYLIQERADHYYRYGYTIDSDARRKAGELTNLAMCLINNNREGVVGDFTPESLDKMFACEYNKKLVLAASLIIAEADALRLREQMSAEPDRFPSKATDLGSIAKKSPTMR